MHFNELKATLEELSDIVEKAQSKTKDEIVVELGNLYTHLQNILEEIK